jgi:hypothetical protein
LGEPNTGLSAREREPNASPVSHQNTPREGRRRSQSTSLQLPAG